MGGYGEYLGTEKERRERKGKGRWRKGSVGVGEVKKEMNECRVTGVKGAGGGRKEMERGGGEREA